MNLFSWLAGCWMAAAICAAIAQTTILGMRGWVPPDPAATLAQVRATLDAQPIEVVGSTGAAEFRVPAGGAAWYALELPPVPLPAVLELTHPSVGSAELFLAASSLAQPAARSGREFPGELRVHNRFPATLSVAASGEPRTVYVRVQAPVQARGNFVLQPRHSWEMLSRLELAFMGMGFGIPLLAAVYALGRASALRSTAYLLYALLTAALVGSGMFITGLGEATLWPALAPWRAQAAALLACFASGLALLLAERAFALEISAPGFGRLLRWAGIACPLAGLAALQFSRPALQAVGHGASVAAMVLGLAGIWMAWRTHNRPAAWLLAGYAPVVLGVSVMTLALVGAIPFQTWTLLVLPLAGMLEIPLNLHGLKLLEQRRAEVRDHLGRLEEVAGHMEETRDEVAERLQLPRVDLPPPDAGATLIMMRFAGLAPGSTAVREHDSVALERFIQNMMAAGLRPGSQVGRWSFNELLLRDLNHADDARLDGLLTSLFAHALRSDRFGIPPGEPRLRIAYVRVRAPRLPVIMLARQMVKALDDPQQWDARRIEIDSWED